MIQGKFDADSERLFLDVFYRVMQGHVRRMDAELAEAKIKISCYRMGDGSIRCDLTTPKEGA